MKLLITGGTGFIGRHVVNEALRQGHKVTILTRSIQKTLDYGWGSEVERIESDIASFIPEFSAETRPDAVIHLAWTGLPNYKSLFHIEQNLPDSIKFIRNIVQSGIQQVLVTGTCFEFGMQSGPLSPATPTYPDNPYAIAKDTLRKWLEKLHAEFTFTHQWVRLFYMYGDGQNPNSILSLLNRALDNGEKEFNMSGGEQLRDYLPVEEVARRLVSIVEHPELSGTRHCCSGKPISIRSLVEDQLKEKNKGIKLNLGHYPYPDYEPMAFWGIE